MNAGEVWLHEWAQREATLKGHSTYCVIRGSALESKHYERMGGAWKLAGSCAEFYHDQPEESE